MTVGRGTEAGVEVGPLIDAAGRDKVAELVDDAVARGRDRRSPAAHAVDGPGYFYPPTVLADVPATARILHEEIFGPVAPIITFDDEDEAVAAANDTEYGLVAYVFTQRPRPRPCACASASRPAWSASTPASSPTPPRPSAASSSPASAARAASGHRRVPRDPVHRHRHFLTAASAVRTSNA